MSTQRQNTGKPWLVSDPSLPPALNRARREVFSLTTASFSLWIIALFYHAAVPFIFLLETGCMLIAFYLIKRHGRHVRMMPSRLRETKVRQPSVFYVLGANPAIMALAAQAYRRHGIPLNDEKQLLPWMVCLSGVLLSVLFIRVSKTTRRSAADYILIIPFLFFGSAGMMRMLNDVVETRPAVVYNTVIMDKYEEHIDKKNGGYRRFEFVIRPDSASPAGGIPVSVTNGLFEQKDIGDSIAVEVHHGALLEPWFIALPR